MNKSHHFHDSLFYLSIRRFTTEIKDFQIVVCRYWYINFTVLFLHFTNDYRVLNFVL